MVGCKYILITPNEVKQKFKKATTCRQEQKNR